MDIDNINSLNESIYENIISCLENDIPNIIKFSKLSIATREATYKYFDERPLSEYYGDRSIPEIEKYCKLWYDINSENCKLYVVNGADTPQLCCAWSRNSVCASILSEKYYTRKIMPTELNNGIYSGNIKFFVTCNFKGIDIRLISRRVPFNTAIPSITNQVINHKIELSPDLEIGYSITTESLMTHSSYETGVLMLTNPIFKIKKTLLYSVIKVSLSTYYYQ
jgi:hypothetical protein